MPLPYIIYKKPKQITYLNVRTKIIRLLDRPQEGYQEILVRIKRPVLS